MTNWPVKKSPKQSPSNKIIRKNKAVTTKHYSAYQTAIKNNI